MISDERGRETRRPLPRTFHAPEIALLDQSPSSAGRLNNVDTLASGLANLKVEQGPGKGSSRSDKENSFLGGPTTSPGRMANDADYGNRTEWDVESSPKKIDRRLSRADSVHALKELTLDEIEVLQRPEVKRLAIVCQLYFIDYYFDLLNYISARRTRLERWKLSHEVSRPDERAGSWKTYCGRERVHLRKRRIKLRAGDFRLLNQIGQGGYGQVFLARKFDTREICALKKMNKRVLHKMDEVRHILVERDILRASHSPWLVKLLYAFQDPDHIYLAMEYVPGGDFRSLLNNSGVLTNRHARFYIAEMFMSVEALHKLGYIHRDLKPENFLLDSTGHIKLTDFGLSSGILSPERIASLRLKLDKVKDIAIPNRTNEERRNLYHTLRKNDPHYARSIVGSPDYMAPEVLHGEEYNFTVDYWSLGCMLYECLAGFPPFGGATSDETWSNLKHWRRRLERPVYNRPEDKEWNFQNLAWDFITRVITSPECRFSGITQVQKHAYFVKNPLYPPIDWILLRSKTPPFIPDLNDEEDVGYFDDFSNEADMAKYKEVHEKQAQLSRLEDRSAPMKQSAFVGFTFRHSNAENKERGNRYQRGDVTNGNFDTMF